MKPLEVRVERVPHIGNDQHMGEKQNKKIWDLRFFRLVRSLFSLTHTNIYHVQISFLCDLWENKPLSPESEAIVGQAGR